MEAKEVDDIITAQFPGAPSRSFEIDIPAQKREANRATLGVIAAELAFDIAIAVLKTSLTGNRKLDIGIELIAGVVGLIAAALTVFHYFLTENIARVIGEELKTGSRSYSVRDIESIRCVNEDVRVISDGKAVLKLTKYHEGCGELIKWARAYRIPLEIDYKEPSRALKIAAVAGMLAVFAVFIAVIVVMLLNV